MDIKTLKVERGLPSLTPEMRQNFLAAGLVYMMLFTPVNMVSQTTAVSAVLILALILRGSFFRFLRSRLKTLVAIIIFLTVNAALSPLPKEASTGAFNVFKGLWILPVAILASDSLTKSRFRWVAMLLSVTASVISIALLTQVVEWQRTYHSLTTWSESHIGNIHNLNNFLFISLLLAGITAWRYHDRVSRILILLAALPIVLMCILVKSEGSILALGCTVLLLTGLHHRNRLSLALAGLPVLTLQVAYVFPEQFSSLTGIQAHTLHVRSQIYSKLFDAWTQHPFMGWGAGTYKYVEAVAVEGTQYLYPHNLYLEALFSVGIIGILIIGAWLIKALSHIDFGAVIEDPARAFALATLTYLCVKGMSDMNLMSYHTVGLLSICFGILLGPKENLKTKQQTSGA